MKTRLLRCECGRNHSEDSMIKSQVTLAFVIWCPTCGRRNLVDVQTFESGTYKPVQFVNQIDWRAS